MTALGAFVAGDILTAADLNAIGKWTSYTPSLTQSGAVTKTVDYAKYAKLDRLVVVTLRLAVTGSGTATNAVLFGLPVAAAYGTAMCIGQGWLYDASAPNNFVGAVLTQSTTTAGIQPGGNNLLGSATFTAALASGDVVSAAFVYEAAS